MQTSTQTKLNQYQQELNNLNQQKNQISVNLQVNQQSLETAQAEVKQIFGTDNIEELESIKLNLQNEIEVNESKLQPTQQAPEQQMNNTALFDQPNQ